jgi:hypothetical protein
MEGLLFFRVYPSDGFRFILIPDGNPSHEFPVLDGNPSSNMNSAISLFKKGTFHHKKGHFWYFEKIGGGRTPGSYAPGRRYATSAVSACSLVYYYCSIRKHRMDYNSN